MTRCGDLSKRFGKEFRARSKGQDDVDNLKNGCACASSQVEDVDALLAITQDVVNCLNRGFG